MHTVYMILFEDGYLYTGMTKNSFRRNKQHFQKRGMPTVIFKERFETESEAVRREKQIKGWSRAKKFAMAEGRASDLVNLSKRRAGMPALSRNATKAWPEVAAASSGGPRRPGVM